MKACTAVRTIAGLLLPLALVGQTDAPRGEILGEIRGTVVDALGVPVPGAEADIVPAGPGHHLVRQAITDQEGRFTMAGLGWTEWRVRAKKEGDGYPDTSFSIFANGSAQSVTLSPAAPSSTVVVTLGPKAGFITPSYVDAESGQPLTAGVKMWMWDEPTVYYSASFMPGRQPSPDVLIPSGKKIGIEFSALGYDPWRYPSGSAPGQPLTLGPGERLPPIKVGLQRSPAMRKLDARLLQPDISEAEVLTTITEMFTVAPDDPRTAQEIVEVVKQRGSTTLPIAILGRFIPEALVSACLDSATPAVRKAALTALYRHGVMVSHLSAKLRAMVSNPDEEPETRGQARQLLNTVH